MFVVRNDMLTHEDSICTGSTDNLLSVLRSNKSSSPSQSGPIHRMPLLCLRHTDRRAVGATRDVGRFQSVRGETELGITVDQVPCHAISSETDTVKADGVNQDNLKPTQFVSPDKVDGNGNRPKDKDEPIKRVKDWVATDTTIYDAPVGHRERDGRCEKQIKQTIVAAGDLKEAPCGGKAVERSPQNVS